MEQLKAWEAAMADYEDALAKLEAAPEVGPRYTDAYEHHVSAATALLVMPVCSPAQIAQKVRVAQNLFHLDEVAPGFAAALLRDLAGLAGEPETEFRLPDLVS